MGNPAPATPVTDGERVYVYFGSLGVLALDFDGNEVWRVPLPVVRMPFGNGTSPMLAGDLVILSREGPDRYVLALNRRTGDTVWKRDLEGCGAGHSTPVLWRTFVVLNRRLEVVALDLNTGERQWWLAWGSGSGDTTPVVTNDVIYAAVWDNFGEPDLRLEIPSFEAIRAKIDRSIPPRSR